MVYSIPYLHQSNIRGGMRQGLGRTALKAPIGIANYRTKLNPVRYSKTKPNPLTLELLWILRALLDASALFITFLPAVLSASAANGSPAPSAQPLKNAANASLRSGFNPGVQ